MDKHKRDLKRAFQQKQREAASFPFIDCLRCPSCSEETGTFYSVVFTCVVVSKDICVQIAGQSLDAINAPTWCPRRNLRGIRGSDV